MRNTYKGTGNKINVTWDGLINGKPVANGMYTYKITVNAPDDKTHCSGQGIFGVGVIEIKPTAVRPKPADGSYALEMTTVRVLVPGSKEAKVKIVAAAVPYSGGHQHTGGRPVGRFIKDGKEAGVEGKTTDGYTRTYEAYTDSSGKLTFYYEPTPFGGIERLKAFVVGNAALTGSVDLLVRVPDLVPMPTPGTGAVYKLVGATTPHPINHYGTSAVVEALKNIALDYQKVVPGAILKYNDMSLGDANAGCGGLFDIDGNWIPPHAEHRLGTIIDMPVGNPDLEKIIRKKGGSPEVHSAGTSNEHWHVRF